MPKKTVVGSERETSAQNLPEQRHTSVAVSSGGAAALQNWRNIRLIIGREYKNRVTQRVFIITSIILLAIVFLAPFIPTVVQFVQSIAARSGSQTQVVVVNKAGAVAGLNEAMLTSYISSQLNGTTTTSPAPYAVTSQPPASLSNLQSQVKHGKLDILLVLDRSPQGDLQFLYDSSADPNNDSNLSTIQTLAQQLTVLDTAHRLGLTPSQIRNLFAPPSLTIAYTQQSQSVRPANEIAASYVLALAGIYLLFYAVLGYAMTVANGVAEEKSSRVMELLLNAATPLQLLAGKIVGIGAAGLSQMVCLVVVGIGALLLQAPLQAALFGANAGGFALFLTGVFLPFYLLFLVYFLLAFFLYATLFAGLGAMVKRQDEVASATQVPLMLIIIAWIPIIFGISSPNAPWMKVLSYFPFWTPMLMLVRIALGAVAWWEIVLTIALMLAAIFACTWFAARLYRLGVLMYGQRPGLGRLIKVAFGR
ncbi:MAG TPA: ABC transporter permease [Ktedonobacteraceae bacterium]|nr:ABC transporter permease [Ktedonobacteraceae bacterium]